MLAALIFIIIILCFIILVIRDAKLDRLKVLNVYKFYGDNLLLNKKELFCNLDYNGLSNRTLDFTKAEVSADANSLLIIGFTFSENLKCYSKPLLITNNMLEFEKISDLAKILTANNYEFVEFRKQHQLNIELGFIDAVLQIKNISNKDLGIFKQVVQNICLKSI